MSSVDGGWPGEASFSCSDMRLPSSGWSSGEGSPGETFSSWPSSPSFSLLPFFVEKHELTCFLSTAGAGEPQTDKAAIDEAEKKLGPKKEE